MPHKKGFTLLEVIVSLTFIASCMVFFLRWQAGSISLVLDSWQQVTDLMKIKNYFARTLYREKKGDLTAEDSQKRATYSFSIKDIDPSSSISELAPKLKQVSSRVVWSERPSYKRQSLPLVWFLSPVALQEEPS